MRWRSWAEAVLSGRWHLFRFVCGLPIFRPGGPEDSQPSPRTISRPARKVVPRKGYPESRAGSVPSGSVFAAFTRTSPSAARPFDTRRTTAVPRGKIHNQVLLTDTTVLGQTQIRNIDTEIYKYMISVWEFTKHPNFRGDNDLLVQFFRGDIHFILFLPYSRVMHLFKFIFKW